MANEGSTKATYSELEAQAAQAANDLSRVKELTRILADEHKLRQAAQNETERVRGLLQRQSDALCGMIATFESGDHADKSSEFGICSTGMCAVCDAQEALDAAMSDIQIPTDAKSDKNPPWIGVEERLPDYQARSIIYLPEGWIGCGWRSELRGGVWLVENCDGVEPYQAGHPTHWMPLPSPPTFPQSSSLVPEGAEAADIGKLDTADKSVALAESSLSSPPTQHYLSVERRKQAVWDAVRLADHAYDDAAVDSQGMTRPEYIGKAATKAFYADYVAASPELLPTQLPKEK